MTITDFLISKHSFSIKEIKTLLISRRVLVNHTPIIKLDHKIKDTDSIKIKSVKKYPSRAAYKLLFAIDSWKILLENEIILDIGSAHGGFVSVLIEKKCPYVIALDVAYGDIDFKLRKNDKVYLLERTNIMKLHKEMLPKIPSFFTCDVSFISLKKVLIHLKSLFKNLQGIALLKPQFEASPKQIDQTGVIQNKNIINDIINQFNIFLKENSIQIIHTAPSPILGTKGNQEFLYYLKW